MSGCRTYILHAKMVDCVSALFYTSRAAASEMNYNGKT